MHNEPATLIGPSAAARRLGLSAERVRQLADRGELRALRTSLGRLFEAADVARLAAERAQRGGRVRNAER